MQLHAGRRRQQDPNAVRPNSHVAVSSGEVKSYQKERDVMSGWSRAVSNTGKTRENVTDAGRTKNVGGSRCVFHCDRTAATTVVYHQQRTL